MPFEPVGTGGSAIDRWDRLHAALASQERRMVIYSLLSAPEEQRLSLPKAAIAPHAATDPERLSIQLQHNHLPHLTDAGYVRWEREPFCVQRGPYFEEVESLFALINESIDRFPTSLIRGCEVYEELYQNARD